MHNRLILLLLAFALTACSAIELREQMSTATAAAELANTVAAEGPVAEARATLAAFPVDGTGAFACRDSIGRDFDCVGNCRGCDSPADGRE